MFERSDDDLAEKVDRIRQEAERAQRDAADVTGREQPPPEPQADGDPAAPAARNEGGSRSSPQADRRSPGPGDVGARRSGSGEPEDLGLEAELRKGLEVLEELLELAPERLDLLSRRVRYARRLGDEGRREQAELELVATLVDADRYAAAQLAGQYFLHHRPRADAIRDLLASLRRERTHEALPFEAEEQVAAAGSPSLRSEVLGEVSNVPDAEQMLPLFLAFYGVLSPDMSEHAVRRHLAAYLREGDRPREALEVLRAGIEDDLPDRPDERTKTLTELALAELRLGEEERARHRIEELAELDDAVRTLADSLW